MEGKIYNECMVKNIYFEDLESILKKIGEYKSKRLPLQTKNKQKYENNW